MSTDGPEIRILLLGDSRIGITTFLSRLTLGSGGSAARPELPVLRDLDQPFILNLRLYGREYTLQFYDKNSPTHYTFLQPAVVVLCYSIAAPESLISVQKYWKPIVDKHFNLDDCTPVILLGLMRDVRTKADCDGSVKPFHPGYPDGDLDHNILLPRTVVYPQEAHRIAQEMRCDLYCECSALTGELYREAFEDIARTAAKTTTSKGGQSEGTSCLLV